MSSEDTLIGRSKEYETTVDVREIIAVLRARRWLILAVTLIVAGSCTAYAFLSSPVYRATTVLVPVGGERGPGNLDSALGQLGGLASLVGIGGFGAKDSATEEALAVLRSREFLERFIVDHNLLPRLFRRRWNAFARRWKGSLGDQPTMARGVKYLNDKLLAVSRDKKTGLVTVSVDWGDRQEAADWANELVARVNAEMRGRAMTNASAYTAYLEKELSSTQLVETREAINRLIEAQIKQRMVASVTREYAFRTVDRALPPDEDDFVWPARAALVFGGLVGGFLLACMAELARSSAKRVLRQ